MVTTPVHWYRLTVSHAHGARRPAAPTGTGGRLGSPPATQQSVCIVSFVTREPLDHESVLPMPRHTYALGDLRETTAPSGVELVTFEEDVQRGGPGQPADRSAGRTVALLVTAERCHFCRDALELLSDLSSRYPITVRSVDLSSPEGTAVATRYRVPFPPVLLLDGEYFGHGRISRKKLTRTLDATFGVGAK